MAFSLRGEMMAEIVGNDSLFFLIENRETEAFKHDGKHVPDTFNYFIPCPTPAIIIITI